MSKRSTHSPEFKARVAMEAISGRKTIQEIAADHAIHPIQVSQWKRQLLDGASELFTRDQKSKVKEEGQSKEAELWCCAATGPASQNTRSQRNGRALPGSMHLPVIAQEGLYFSRTFQCLHASVVFQYWLVVAA
jgi:transposase